MFIRDIVQEQISKYSGGSIDLSHVGITDEELPEIVSSLSHLENLTGLGLHGNHIVNLRPLSDLKNLTFLALGCNHIVDLRPLSDLKNLNYLTLHGNRIVDISPLADLTNLPGLRIDGNQIVEDDLIPNSENEWFKTGSTPEGKAVVVGDLDSLKRFQAEGLDLALVIPGSDQWNVLHLALASESREVDPDFIRYLIDQGADVAAQDRYGMTPMHYAARSHRAKIVRVLTEAGAPPNIKTYEKDETPLVLAIVRTSPSPETMDALLAAEEAQHTAQYRNWLRNTIHTIPGHGFMKDLVAKYLDPEIEPEE